MYKYYHSTWKGSMKREKNHEVDGLQRHNAAGGCEAAGRPTRTEAEEAMLRRSGCKSRAISPVLCRRAFNT